MFKIGNVVRLKNHHTCGIVSDIYGSDTSKVKTIYGVTFLGDRWYTTSESDLEFLNRNLVDFFLDYK